MGRGRGKGKKLPVATSHEDPGSGGEEPLPAYKRRGRPQKPLKDDIDEEENEKIEEEEAVGDDIKPTISSKEMKGALVENGRKRKRQLVNESSDSALDANGAGAKSGNGGDSAKPNGFRQNGNRRKSKPRRAAEAVVECK